MLKIEDVSKTYKRGDIKALKNVSLEVERGEFVALLGPNGAGKSTLINVLAGNVIKDSGRIEVGGFDLDKNELETKKILGIVPQEIAFDFFFNVKETLKNQSGYFGIKDNDEDIDKLLKRLSLFEKRESNCRRLSGGMKRRLLIAKALIHKPELLILDEPTAGVDIELRHSLYEFLNYLHQNGTTIILTTHYIEEAEKLCDRIIVINHGEIISDSSKKELLDNFSEKVEMEFYFEKSIKLDDLNFLEEYNPSLKSEKVVVLKAGKRELQDIVGKISEKNIKFIDVKLQDAKLEDVFLNLIKKGDENE